MDLGLHGRAAGVLGASSGMGRAIAERFAVEGADLVLLARREEPLRRAAKEIEGAHGVRVHPVVGDVRSMHDLERFFDAAEMEYARLDALVTNHGGPAHGSLETLTEAEWQEAFELIVLSTVRATRLAVPLLRRRTAATGAVVHVVSTAAKQPIVDLLLSNTLRPAVLGLTKATSLELAPDGIRVNAVLPGLTDTARLRALNATRAEAEGVNAEEVLRRREAGIPLRRIARPEEVADTVVYLASERAAYVTGQAWAVEGGLLQGTP